MSDSSPEISVVVVSDYSGGESRSWEDLAHCISAIIAQEGRDRIELLFCEDSRFATTIPTELRALVPATKLCLVESSESVVLKNEGVKRAEAPLVAIIDGDCTPEPGWLQAILETFEQRSDVAVVSGRTLYRNRTTSERVLGLLSRSYMDPGRADSIRFIANNNMAFRKKAYLQHPLPTGFGPFVAELQSEALLRAGHTLWYEPRMLVIHEFDGWAMEVDLRRTSGFGLVLSRLRDHNLPFSSVVRRGKVAIPAIVVGRILKDWKHTLRCWRQFGLRPWEIPVSFVLSGVIHMLEIPGMLSAYQGRSLGESAYR